MLDVNTVDKIINGKTFRKCSKCQKHKIITQYPKASWCSGGHRKTCTPCGNKVREVSRARFKKKNPKFRQANTLRYKYGITIEEYLKLIKDQNNKCVICNEGETTKGKTLSVDHCHSTGKIRGLLCHGCNTGIGFLKDNIKTMESAISYIKRNMNE